MFWWFNPYIIHILWVFKKQIDKQAHKYHENKPPEINMYRMYPIVSTKYKYSSCFISMHNVSWFLIYDFDCQWHKINWLFASHLFKMYTNEMEAKRLPCRYGRSLHISSPNTKSRSSVPINVMGMHRTPNKISEMAKFSRNTLVMVRIRRFWISVRITNAFPIMANNRMVM